MKRRLVCSLLVGAALSLPALAQRTTTQLEQGWRFSREDKPGTAAANFDDRKWSQVTVPHDWAIYGPFSFENDKQHLAITQDGQLAARGDCPSSAWAGIAASWRSPATSGSAAYA